jgi:SpoVK/Ycf46/Vps4 family AAA+-type ATPase
MFAFILQILGVVFLALILLVSAFALHDKRKKAKAKEEEERKQKELEEEFEKLDLELEVPHHQFDAAALDIALEKLNMLDGLNEIKNEVNELVKVAKYELEEGEFDYRSNTLHYVFTGNPGTGKTTVARLLAQIYKALGVLSKGQLVEVDRSSLVAGYVGQTAILTKKMIDEAMGGVLFIDEAYALAGMGAQDFGKEAIDTLLKSMEDRKGEFMVIVAGYDKPMEVFLSSNPGLRSRFDKKFQFEDYDQTSLCNITFGMFEAKGKKLSDEAVISLKAYFESRVENRSHDFGNAREARKVVLEALKNQKLRLADILLEERSEDQKDYIILEDVAEFKALLSQDTPTQGRRPIGYDYDGED